MLKAQKGWVETEGKEEGTKGVPLLDALRGMEIADAFFPNGEEEAGGLRTHELGDVREELGEMNAKFGENSVPEGLIEGVLCVRFESAVVGMDG